MLTLFHAPLSRSSRIIWLLEELDAPYELKIVNIRRRDGSGALDPANPHPHGKVPAIEHHGQLIFETPAILLYLTDSFPKNGLGPLPGDPQRGEYLSMLAYYGDVMEPAFLSKLTGAAVPRGSAGWVVVEEAMEFIEQRLAKRRFMLGEDYSALDLLYGSTFALFGQVPELPQSQLVKDYTARCLDRPARLKAEIREQG